MIAADTRDITSTMPALTYSIKLYATAIST